MGWTQMIFVLLRSLLRSQAELAAEKLDLRQQLAILEHCSKRPGYGTATGSSGCGCPASGRIGAPSSTSSSRERSSGGTSTDGPPRRSLSFGPASRAHIEDDKVIIPGMYREAASEQLP